MNSIYLKDYNSNMGKLISLESREIFNINHVIGSINIPYEELLYNREKYLNKNDTYYLYCNKGHKSTRAVNILSAYGYKVIKVII